MAAAQPDQAREVLDPEQFRDVIGYFATGVTVITTAHEGPRSGQQRVP